MHRLGAKGTVTESPTKNRFLLRRGDLERDGWTPQEVAGLVFFNMWQKRQSPYAVLSGGDTLYWWFVGSGKLRWELRVREPVKVAYDSYQDVYRVLRQAYGL